MFLYHHDGVPVRSDNTGTPLHAVQSCSAPGSSPVSFRVAVPHLRPWVKTVNGDFGVCAEVMQGFVQDCSSSMGVAQMHMRCMRAWGKQTETACV